MKSFLIKLMPMVLSVHVLAMRAPDDPNEAAKWYALIDSGIIKWTTSNESGKKIKNLGDYVFKLGMRGTDHPDPRWRSAYQKAQTALISIPYHARYFADEIKRQQKSVASYPTSTGPRVSYDRQRSWHFETLSRLPSPETIAVLGDFLADDIDTPIPLVSPHSDWGENPRANSYASSFTISSIGLRDPPAEKKLYEDSPDDHLAATRAWWSEVKTGKRKFSFRGQAVEYRFKPDGTWDTLAIANPPDDGPKPVATVLPKRSEVPPGPGDSKSGQTTSRLWPWILIAMIGGLVLAVWTGLRKSS